MHDIVSPTLEKNGLLAALHPHDREIFATSARIVRIASGSVLYEPGDQVTAAFFPLGEAVASFMVVLEDGSSVETAMVGREGAIGGIVSTGHLASYSRAAVMHGGYFARIDSNALEDLKTRAPGIRDLLSRYADCLLAQIFQSVACNAVHGLDQRAAKWLIVAVDRTGSNRVALTQEHFGALLGVARSYVSSNIRKGILFSNVAGYSNPEVDRLFEEAAVATSDAKRQELYTAVQKIVVEEVPIAWMIEQDFPTFIDKRLKNVITTGIGVHETFGAVTLG